MAWRVLGLPMQLEFATMNVESLSLSWRVETRRFHLLATSEGAPELRVNDRPGISLTAEEWCALGDVLFRIGLDWPGGNGTGPATMTAVGGGSSVKEWPANASVADAAVSRRGRAWTDEEESRLLAAFDAGDAPSEIARALTRSRAGVLARLAKFGRVDAAEVGLRYPVVKESPPPHEPPMAE